MRNSNTRNGRRLRRADSLNQKLRHKRILAAFLAAPAVTAVFFLICYAVSWIFASRRPHWDGPLDILLDVVYLLIIYWLFAVVVAVLLGGPIYLLYRWRGWRSWLAFGIGGTVIGCATAILLVISEWAMFLDSPPILSAYCAVAGLLSSLAFRAIAFGGHGESNR